MKMLSVNVLAAWLASGFPQQCRFRRRVVKLVGFVLIALGVGLCSNWHPDLLPIV